MTKGENSMLVEQLELDLGNVSPSVDILNLRPIQIRALKDRGVLTISKLIEESDKEAYGLCGYLIKMKNFGRKTATGVMTQLNDLEIGYK